VLQFDYRGEDHRRRNRPRQVLLELFLGICAVLLFPFTLLSLLFWGVGRTALTRR
jgi:hypothetical protein